MNGVSYHWIITLSWGNGVVNTADGTCTPEPGTTRQKLYYDVYDYIVNDARQKRADLPAPPPTVVFFSLGRDDLDGHT